MSSSRFVRRLRKQIDEAGVSASIVADVNVAVSTSDTSPSSRSVVRVRQTRAALAELPPPTPEPKETP